MQISKDQFHCKSLNFVVPRRHLKTFVTKIFFDILFENILSYSLSLSLSLSLLFLPLSISLYLSLAGVIQHSVKCQILLFLNDVPCPAESLCAFNPSQYNLSSFNEKVFFLTLNGSTVPFDPNTMSE